MSPVTDGARVWRDLEALAAIGATPEGGVTRPAFSDEDIASRRLVTGLMDDAGLRIRVDAAGNIIGRREGRRPGPLVMTGSHTDTVINGGRFDGAAGVVAAIEVARALDRERVQLAHPLEVVVFAGEESNRFGLSTVGSRAMAGRLTASVACERRDASGMRLADAWERLGARMADLATARRAPGTVKAHVELHVEQGAVLDELGVPIGIVTGLVGIGRWHVTVRGRADHAGTTPMHRRRDALTGASAVALVLEDVCRAFPGSRVVGTAGRVEVFPNHPTTVPDSVRLEVDHRALTLEDLGELQARLRNRFAAIGAERDLTILVDTISQIDPVATDPGVVATIGTQCRRLGVQAVALPSRAGHDTNHVAAFAPVGMIFVPSREGISHNPRESTRPEDLAVGVEVLFHTLVALCAE